MRATLCLDITANIRQSVDSLYPSVHYIADYHGLTVTLAMVGKVGAAAAFAVIYIFSAELFPTIVRNAGMARVPAVAGRVAWWRRISPIW